MVSPSWSSGNNAKITAKKGGVIQINSQKKVTFCPTFYTKNKVTNYLKIIFSLVWLFFWLLKNVKKDEKIIVYHVQWLSVPIRWAKKIKRFKLILEVEEFYGKVWENKKILNKWEEKLIKSADNYIAVSDVLAEMLGIKVKAIIYGDYSLPDLNNSSSCFMNDKINVVYAGSIDNNKGGAYKAIECAELLPENYIVHILGSGNKNDIDRLIKQIALINKKAQRNACMYHGVLPRKDYDALLCSCQIGLNPQIEGDYTSALFPSKVISYLSHNLRVVSTRINSITKSKLRHLISFSDDDRPESIVKCILSININNAYDSVSVIKELNDCFIKDIKELLM
jgi:hypothetical protein